MRTFILAIFLLFSDLAFSQGLNYMAPAIPKGGAVQQLCGGDSTCSPSNVFVGTGGAAVNLGSNSYSLQTNGTPPVGTSFVCRFDATQLTAVAANVSIFGLTPLKDYPNQGIYYILYQVSGTRNNNKHVYVTYQSSMVQPTVVPNTVTFNGSIYSNDSTVVKRLRLSPATPRLAGSGVIAGDSSGNLTYGCPSCAWNVLGNSGTNSSANFLGTTDTAALRFRVNSLPSGIMDYNKFNTAFGVYSMASNTTGTNNVAIGAEALYNNTTGNNTAVGCFSSGSITTGSGNTGVGRSSLLNYPTTGNNNTAIGGNATVVAGSTTGATSLGYSTTANNYGIALGYTAVASANQLAVSPSIENLNIPLNGGGYGNSLKDTTTAGIGVYISQPNIVQGYYTPVTTNTIATPTTTADIFIGVVNPASTIAALTINLPVGRSNQIITYTFQQAVTAITWTPVSGSVTNVPTTAAQGKVISMVWCPSTSSWFPAN